MINITDEDWKYFYSYLENFVNREEIYKVIKKKASFEQFVELLYSCRYKEDSINKFGIIFSLFPHSMNVYEFTKMCQIFLKELWHREHETMIGYLQDDESVKSKENIDVLLYLMNNLPEFYKYDDDLKYPFIRKIFYAIASQPKPYSREVLEELALNKDERIKEYALYQLERIEQVGNE